MVENDSQSPYNSEFPIVMHTSIKAKMYDYYKDRKKNHWAQAMGLYCFVYDAVRYQGTNKPWVTDTFIRKGTGLGRRLLLEIKHDLIKMGLIEIHKSRDEHGVLGKRYTEVKFAWKDETVEKLFYQEPDSTTEYKIARDLLLCNFEPNEEIEAPDYYEFDAEVRGDEVVLSAETFYFDEDGLLIAKAEFYTGEDGFDYIVPSDRAGEIVKELANNYKFSLSAILKVLNSSKSP